MRTFLTAASALIFLASTPAAADRGERIIPLQRQAGNQLSIDGEIAGHRGIFLFDSGWGVSAVTPDMAKRIGCKPWGQMTGFRAIGERVDSKQCQPVTAKFAASSLPLPTLILVDLQPYVSPNSPIYAGAIGLDAFAGKTVTIRLHAQQIVIETPESLKARITRAKAIPVRLVRDGQGASLTVNVGVPTSSGMLWMVLDTGNNGGTMVGQHAASLLGLDPGKDHGQRASIPIIDEIVVAGPVQVLKLIMDGDIGRDFLDRWDVTLDLAHGMGWLARAEAEPVHPIRIPQASPLAVVPK